PEENKPETSTEKAAVSAEETFFTKVRVVDPDGNPVVGAEVEPWGFRFQGGSSGLWMNENTTYGEPPIVKTDARGEVAIPVPQPLPPLIGLTCRVTHPEFAETMHNVVSVAPEDPEYTSIIP